MKDCNQCGKCCIKYGDGGLSASASEVDFWATFRPHIYEYVDGHDNGGNIWISPDTGKPSARCPWLRQVACENKSGQGEAGRAKYICDIYYDRPDDCRHYPVTIEQMAADACEMIELRDLDNPRKAQKDLDKRMAGSRPACS